MAKTIEMMSVEELHKRYWSEEKSAQLPPLGHPMVSKPPEPNHDMSGGVGGSTAQKHMEIIKAAARLTGELAQKYSPAGPAVSVGSTSNAYWIGVSTGAATSPPESGADGRTRQSGIRTLTYDDGAAFELARIQSILQELAPRSTKIQRGMAESWKAEGAREQFDKMMKALGEGA